eukprot:scaffold975_cov398-Prasinococcus_capsulatus_cf.AAC.9
MDRFQDVVALVCIYLNLPPSYCTYCVENKGMERVVEVLLKKVLAGLDVRLLLAEAFGSWVGDEWASQLRAHHMPTRKALENSKSFKQAVEQHSKVSLVAFGLTNDKGLYEKWSKRFEQSLGRQCLVCSVHVLVVEQGTIVGRSTDCPTAILGDEFAAKRDEIFTLTYSLGRVPDYRHESKSPQKSQRACFGQPFDPANCTHIWVDSQFASTRQNDAVCSVTDAHSDNMERKPFQGMFSIQDGQSCTTGHFLNTLRGIVRVSCLKGWPRDVGRVTHLPASNESLAECCVDPKGAYLSHVGMACSSCSWAAGASHCQAHESAACCGPIGGGKDAFQHVCPSSSKYRILAPTILDVTVEELFEASAHGKKRDVLAMWRSLPRRLMHGIWMQSPLPTVTL